jgi:uncharacterized protein with von Willebrand factor type A (vWA) domain
MEDFENIIPLLREYEKFRFDLFQSEENQKKIERIRDNEDQSICNRLKEKCCNFLWLMKIKKINSNILQYFEYFNKYFNDYSMIREYNAFCIKYANHFEENPKTIDLAIEDLKKRIKIRET